MRVRTVLYSVAAGLVHLLLLVNNGVVLSYQRGHILTIAVVELDSDHILACVLKRNRQVTEVLGELAARTLDGDIAGFDSDLDALRDGQGLF
jgi:hypothetical protein